MKWPCPKCSCLNEASNRECEACCHRSPDLRADPRGL
jgi:hypothetical protein